VSGDAVAEVGALERRLLDPSVRADVVAVDALLHPDFVEFGASGRVWDRPATLAALAAESDTTVIEVFDLVGEQVAEHVVLLTFRTRRAGRLAVRSSVWVRDGDRWRVRFHQGTLVP
jgi:ribonuclease HI